MANRSVTSMANIMPPPVVRPGRAAVRRQPLLRPSLGLTQRRTSVVAPR